MRRNQNPNAHLTAKKRDRASWPTRKLLGRGLIKGDVLDFGCGFGADVDFLSRKGFNVTGYDPHYAPDYPTKRFDTIICHYVLNVLFPDQQSAVLMQIAELLRPGGCAYFAVRRDLRRPGFRMHKLHQRQTYQANVYLPYRTVLKTDFCEIYEYQHVNHRNSESDSNCPFCSPSSSRELVTESARCYAMFDKYPVSDGHALIIPKRHVATYFDLSDKEQSACWIVIERTRDLLQERFNPDGFNVGINDSAAAGQTIEHAHIHLIPRYEGDVEDPVGGVRNVIPGRGNYL